MANKLMMIVITMLFVRLKACVWCYQI